MDQQCPEPGTIHCERYAPSLILRIAFLAGESLPSPSEVFEGAEKLLNPLRNITPPDERRHWICEVCKDKETGEAMVIVGGETEWTAHLQSVRHKARLKGLKKRREYEEWKASQEVKEWNAMNPEYDSCI
jgi:hypothetical protein